jgi:transposase
MPSLVKKMKSNKAYYYIVQSARVNGKPRIVWQKYLGTVEGILKLTEKNLAPTPSEVVLFEAGGVAALLNISQKLDLVKIIDEIVPKRDQGPSVGQYILLAAINRALDPLSKRKIGEWYDDTSLKRLWKFSSDIFSSQRFWDHMDMISQEAIEQIQDKLVEKIKDNYRLEAKILLYDTTNFFTYINTHNDRNDIAQRGHNKQKRTDLRQINLALLASKDFQIPLFHKAYKGNVPDVKSFVDISYDLREKHKKFFGPSESTLVFDKGHLSEDTMERLLYNNIHFVSGVKADFLKKIFEIPSNRMQEIPQLPGTKGFETLIELYGKSCRAVVSYSESFFTQQLASLTSSMVKCQDKLKELQKNLNSYLQKPKGPKPTLAAIKKRLKDILSCPQMKEVFFVSLDETTSIPQIQYSINKEGFDRLTSTRLGRTLLITNRLEWSVSEVITHYRELEKIEEVFKHLKNRQYLHWQPAFHWTDQKLAVHTFYCVLALMLVSLARKTACENGLEITFPALLEELSGIKEVALLYPTEKGKFRTQCTFSKMSFRQKKLAELFNIGSILGQG